MSKLDKFWIDRILLILSIFIFSVFQNKEPHDNIFLGPWPCTQLPMRSQTSLCDRQQHRQNRRDEEARTRTSRAQWDREISKLCTYCAMAHTVLYGGGNPECDAIPIEVRSDDCTAQSKLETLRATLSNIRKQLSIVVRTFQTHSVI